MKIKNRECHVFAKQQSPYRATDLGVLSPQPDTSLHCETTENASHSVSVYVPFFAGIRCAYPVMEGWPG